MTAHPLHRRLARLPAPLRRNRGSVVRRQGQGHRLEDRRRGRQIPVRERQRLLAKKQDGSPRASTSAVSWTTIRRARTGPTPSWASATRTWEKAPRSRYVLAGTSSRNSCSTTRQTRAPTTRSTSWGSRTSTRCTSPGGISRRRAGGPGAGDLRREVPNSSLMPEAQSKLREAKDRVGDVGLSDRLLLLQEPLVSGSDRSLQGAAERGSGIHQSRRRVLLPRRSVDEE